MKKLILSLALSIVLAGSVFAAFPMPSVNGPTGLVRIPDAQVIPYKNWNIGIDYGAAYPAGSANTVPALLYKANMGSFNGFELGLVGGYDAVGTALREGVFINLKYAPSIGDGSDPLLLAMGVENLASFTQTAIYMVATKPFKQGPSLSFGFMGDFPGNNRFRPLGMAGLDVPMGAGLHILGDLFAGETVFQVNAGIRYFLLPTFAIDGRAINIAGPSNTQVSKDSKQYLVGISWANPF
ncbi:hypothetical protein A2276_00605 [candidate division WOR-1 bacterium RIFOXYA12_FULL_43_27]|uniref:Outer membrane protein beta-barrel domain-containing protein n=1 Tax=candidate division WOR-1 bacterium RIFOXYC2_FULL_46_14 TaxID=1802587 RepID=A0A1F4U4W4_UNCSA|nr:MAG: hypothetical protein A2276_00605 [candidate division WOR-1 bacterium RIFOXYA12_FULL_43_27]OGC20808.1 MAG: hypothetical protein A2292_07270 [candidate division WOR-1 bacterium RIFOXYB2_FULL_46_45]OGC31455.1 MAG: hypothetical protein A2232_04180 [candidate division WOR-1 bacterium RIFOXYA2_FULL_46_56]OGC39860.1 MAG: hypothetical protein A2438_05015 [candidate division WOR-1 bacterium RIFOXYC2_FULL_46_14]